MRSVAERAKEEEPVAVLPSRAAQLEAETPDTPPEPVVVRMPVGVRGSSLRILVVLGATLMAQYAQALLIPIVIGILISYSLAPLVSGLERLRIPRALGAGLAVLSFSTVGIRVSTLSDQAIQTVSSVPEVASGFASRSHSTKSSAGRHIPDGARATGSTRRRRRPRPSRRRPRRRRRPA